MSAELRQSVVMTGVQLPFGNGRDLSEASTLVSVSYHSMCKVTQQFRELVAVEEEKWQENDHDEQFLLQNW